MFMPRFEVRASEAEPAAAPKPRSASRRPIDPSAVVSPPPPAAAPVAPAGQIPADVIAAGPPIDAPTGKLDNASTPPAPAAAPPPAPAPPAAAAPPSTPAAPIVASVAPPIAAPMPTLRHRWFF